MADDSNTNVPGDGWTSIMGTTGIIARAFIYGFNRTKVEGLENLTNILDARRENPESVEHGLITGKSITLQLAQETTKKYCTDFGKQVSNHISVCDDSAFKND